MPKRPPWNYSMKKEELDENENNYFDNWLKSIYEAVRIILTSVR